MLKIDGVENEAKSYITCDTNGVWLWSVEPVLEDNKWTLPIEYRGKQGIGLFTDFSLKALCLILNNEKIDFNCLRSLSETPKIFTISASGEINLKEHK